MGAEKHTKVWTNPKINISKCGWVLHSLEYHLYLPSSIRNWNHLAKLYCHSLHSHPLTSLVWAHYKWTFSHLSCFHQLAASNRLSGAPTERLQARIWSKKWGLSDGGERALWQQIKRKGKVKVYDWAGGGAAKRQSQGEQQKFSRFQSMLYCWESCSWNNFDCKRRHLNKD